jgi:hypothetical protein
MCLLIFNTVMLTAKAFMPEINTFELLKDYLMPFVYKRTEYIREQLFNTFYYNALMLQYIHNYYL